MATFRPSPAPKWPPFAPRRPSQLLILAAKPMGAAIAKLRANEEKRRAAIASLEKQIKAARAVRFEEGEAQ